MIKKRAQQTWDHVNESMAKPSGAEPAIAGYWCGICKATSEPCEHMKPIILASGTEGSAEPSALSAEQFSRKWLLEHAPGILTENNLKLWMSQFAEAYARERLQDTERERDEVDDGFGNVWGPCSTCNSRMSVVRPGYATCQYCDDTGFLKRELTAAQAEIKELERQLIAVCDLDWRAMFSVGIDKTNKALTAAQAELRTMKEALAASEERCRVLEEALRGIVGWCNHESHGKKYDLPKPLLPYILQGEIALKALEVRAAPEKPCG